MLKPRTPIRRFDVFAEYNRLKAIEDGMSPKEAEGYGLWVAKVVASRGFGRGVGPKPPREGDKAGHDKEGAAQGEDSGEKRGPRWRMLDSKPQTDVLFEQEIINRMGREFYETVFKPAIEEAVREGRSYQSIRDTIRREWKPG